MQRRGQLLEGQRHLEIIILHLQRPILVLDDDGHFLRILLLQEIGNIHARMMGFEGQIEMMRPDQARFLDPFQRVAHHATQRGVGQSLIADEIFRHGNRETKRRA